MTRSALTRSGRLLAADGDSGDKFRLVLSGQIQLGAVVGIVAFSVVLLCALLAVVIVCRRRKLRRRRRESADDIDAMEVDRKEEERSRVGSQLSKTGPDAGEGGTSPNYLQTGGTIPKDWTTKLPVDVISNATPIIQVTVIFCVFLLIIIKLII